MNHDNRLASLKVFFGCEEFFESLLCYQVVEIRMVAARDLCLKCWPFLHYCCSIIFESLLCTIPLVRMTTVRRKLFLRTLFFTNVANILFTYVIMHDDVIQRWRTVRDNRALTKYFVLGVIINALKHNRASELINI